MISVSRRKQMIANFPLDRNGKPKSALSCIAKSFLKIAQNNDGIQPPSEVSLRSNCKFRSKI